MPCYVPDSGPLDFPNHDTAPSAASGAIGWGASTPTRDSLESVRPDVTANRWAMAGPCFLATFMAALFLASWAIWFAPWDDWLDRSGTPLGADFAMFYTAGRVVNDGQLTSLYDQAEHQRRLQTQFQGLAPTFCLPYRYPPTVALAAGPLARLPYPIAWLVFCGLSVVALTTALALLRPDVCILDQLTGGWWLLIAATWPVVLETLVGGQASLFGLFILVASTHLFGRGREVAGGAVLALACYKPNLLALFVVGCLIRFPRAWRGFVPVGALALVITAAGTGTDVLEQYWRLGRDLALRPWDLETPAGKTHGLVSLFPPTWVSVIRPALLAVGVAVAAGISWSWRRTHHSASDRRFPASLVVVNALCNAYTPIYDLVLLLPATLWILEWELNPARFGGARLSAAWQRTHALRPRLLVMGTYLGPHLSQALFPSLGFQTFSLAMLLLVMVGYALATIDPRASESLGRATC